jgi:peptidoglycan lytic transglycosylase D
VNPEAKPRRLPIGWLGIRAPRAGLLVIAAFVITAAGCASTSHLVKESLDPKPLLENAISRAICFTRFTGKSCPAPSKPGGVPPLPADENTSRVQKFVREYAYGERETMKRFLARAGNYLTMVKGMATKTGMPQDLAYLFLLESGANPEARSRANALGMWQFMPATARSYGLRVDSWVDERLDPKKSTKAALAYLKDLYGMFGCWRLALSAYNSGENKLNKVLREEDASEYRQICTSPHLKRETREFYPRFLALAQIAKNPEKYGFAPVHAKGDPPTRDTVLIKGTYSLKKLAKMIGVSAGDMEEMNPSLIRDCTPPAPCYAVRVPAGKKRVLLAKIKDTPPDVAKRTIVHVISRRDSLAKILRRYRVSRVELAELNPDVNLRYRLKHGVRLIVPTKRVPIRKAKRFHRRKRLTFLR